jgi:hypothetical protein
MKMLDQQLMRPSETFKKREPTDNEKNLCLYRIYEQSDIDGMRPVKKNYMDCLYGKYLGRGQRRKEQKLDEEKLVSVKPIQDVSNPEWEERKRIWKESEFEELEIEKIPKEDRTMLQATLGKYKNKSGSQKIVHKRKSDTSRNADSYSN